jgi:hypothetical protein
MMPHCRNSAHSNPQVFAVMSRDHTAVRLANLDCMQDLSDIQWRQFREGLPLAAAAMAAFAAASRAVSALPRRLRYTTPLSCVISRRRQSDPLLQAQRWAPGITHTLVTLVFSLCYLGEASKQRSS